MSKNFRDDSRCNWNSESTIESINAGSLQRIADATEKMAVSYSQLIQERDKYKKWYEEERAKVQGNYNSMAALRGVITKLKKKLNKPT